MSEALTYKEFYDCAGVEQHRQFEDYLARIIFDKDEREAFYRRLLEINSKVSVDTFKPYFEMYSAERKSFQQDYTPDAVTKILAEITRSDADDYKNSLWSGYDPTAGTGAMLIAKWHDDRIQESPWSYAPHNYFYRADELADNVIPYLIHNLTLRGMNAVVVHGDVLSRKIRNIYFIQNTKDDFLGFSDINVMPRSEQVEKLFDVREWVGEPIVHVESPLMWDMIPPVLPMQRKAREVSKEPPKFETVHSFENAPRVKDVALVERAKKGRIYPKGTILIQMSATRGQMGVLESDGYVETHYACICPHWSVDSDCLALALSLTINPWFARVKEGLNVTLEDIADMPIHRWETKQVPIKYGQLSLFDFE
ncbi:TPA: SAM-dependent DNA methyltransferase [Streptococcus suis]